MFSHNFQATVSFVLNFWWATKKTKSDQKAIKRKQMFLYKGRGPIYSYYYIYFVKLPSWNIQIYNIHSQWNHHIK
jgi:hypothetical protein